MNTEIKIETETNENEPSRSELPYAHNAEKTSKTIIIYTFFVSLAFLITVPIAVWYSGESDFFEGMRRILTSPSELVTDYFALGGLGCAFLNAAVCGFACNVLMLVSRVKANATTLAGYLLVVAHCFYGLNFVNMWPSIFGILLYCGVMKKSFRENLHIAFFSTALAPFVSDMLFRYSIGTFNADQTRVTAGGIVMSVLFGLAVGFVVPALLPGTTKMHRGYNMYKAGLAIGILGIFIFAFMYATMGVSAPQKVIIDNPAYDAMPYAYRGFMNCFFALFFGANLAVGFFMNGKSFRGYGKLIKCSGYGTDFSDKFGMPLCFINIGFYGFCILAYLNTVFLLPGLLGLPPSDGFSGATVGVAFAALTFASDGQHPRNVYPIAIGYTLLFALTYGICVLSKFDMTWSLSSQSYMNGLAFATGLCPFAGKYGAKIGILAGFVCAIICTSTAEMHGGFVLYNGGFTAGLTALILLPILDFYKVQPKYDDDV